MGREYVPIFFDWLDVTQDLTPEEKGNLIDAVVAYASGKEYEHLLTGCCRIAFRFLKGQVDRNNAISDARAKAGSSKREQPEAKENKDEQKETKNEKEKKDNTKNFAPPTIEEVTEYCQERNNGVNPQKFIDFYSSKGWKVGNQPMKDWKASVRTWEQRDKTPSKTVSAQEYSQRDYTGEQDEALQRMLRQMQEGA